MLPQGEAARDRFAHSPPLSSPGLLANGRPCLPFFSQLPHPSKGYVVIPDAGHMMHLQKGPYLFQDEVAAFLTAP